MVDEECVLEVWYDKDAKNKVRSFYRQYYRLIKGFFEDLEKDGNMQSTVFTLSKDDVIKRIRKYKSKKFQPEESETGMHMVPPQGVTLLFN